MYGKNKKHHTTIGSIDSSLWSGYHYPLVVITKTMSEIKYIEIEESFGMGGPYLGKLEFQGKILDGKYIADGEKISNDSTKVIFSKFLGYYQVGSLLKVSKRDFRILVFEKPTMSFFQSIASFELLCIKKMEGNIITFHKAFHTKIHDFENQIEFDEKNFEKLLVTNSDSEAFDKNFTDAIVKELKKRLERALNPVEEKAFKVRRSGIAYEMMLDFVSDSTKSKAELEKYVANVVEVKI